MREFKFRAWDSFNKKWLPQEVFSIGIDDGRLRNKSCAGCIGGVELMQYTGIKDKNGVEIYEGDILKAHGEVVWNQDEFRWSCVDLTWNDKREWHDLDYLTSAFEVIGNIYEDNS